MRLFLSIIATFLSIITTTGGLLQQPLTLVSTSRNALHPPPLPRKRRTSTSTRSLHTLRGGATAVSPASTAAALSAWYMERLTVAPLRTKSATLLVISAVSDTLSQRIAARRQSPPPPFSFHRLRVFATMGALFIAPIVHYWFGLLDALSRTPAFAGRPQWQVIGAQLVLDQSFAAPVVLASIFMVVGFFDQALRLRPFSVRACAAVGRERLRADYVPTLLVNWRLWPLANTLNFWLVPPPLRVLYSNCVSVIWEIYLSTQVNKRGAKKGDGNDDGRVQQ